MSAVAAPDPSIPMKNRRGKEAFQAPGPPGRTVPVRSPNVPGYERRVDAIKYQAMKKVLLKVMPRKAPGITQAEMMDALRKAAPRTVFAGRTYRWWGKSVQLDLEACGVLVRVQEKPLRWHVAPSRR
jgi:hypothetical protein